jgi:hypothetical protein
MGLEAMDHRLRVNPAQIGNGRQRCIPAGNQARQATGNQLILNRVQPRRRLGMPAAHVMQQAIRMRKNTVDTEAEKRAVQDGPAPDYARRLRRRHSPAFDRLYLGPPVLG